MSVDRQSMTTSTKRNSHLARRRVGVKLVKITVDLTEELVQISRQMLAGGTQSFAGFVTEALRAHVEGKGAKSDAESQFVMLNRKLMQLSRKQEVTTATGLAVGETLGILLQVLLGSLPMPRTPQEQKQFNDQVAERMPNAIDAVAENLLTRAYMKRYLPTRVATEEDFPTPPPG